MIPSDKLNMCLEIVAGVRTAMTRAEWTDLGVPEPQGFSSDTGLYRSGNTQTDWFDDKGLWHVRDDEVRLLAVKCLRETVATMGVACATMLVKIEELDKSLAEIKKTQTTRRDGAKAAPAPHKRKK